MADNAHDNSRKGLAKLLAAALGYSVAQVWTEAEARREKAQEAQAQLDACRAKYLQEHVDVLREALEAEEIGGFSVVVFTREGGQVGATHLADGFELVGSLHLMDNAYSLLHGMWKQGVRIGASGQRGETEG